jgi:predicted Co/Zn/Cd cation transporter (cation efflux family)
MIVAQRAAQTLLAGLGLLMVVFLASVYAAAEGDTVPDDAKALIASAGVGLGLLVIVLATAGVSSGERWAWLALWVVPAFMLSHCLLLGTWLPDGIFLVLSVVALVVTRPRYDTA